MKFFSFRAESFQDVQEFLNATSVAGTTTVTIVKPHSSGFADHDIEIQSDQSIEELRDIMRSIPGALVMVQTLRCCTLTENSFERDQTL